MTPSKPTNQQTLLIEKPDRQYEILIGVIPTGQITLMGVRNALTCEPVDSSVIADSDIQGALELLRWAIENDPDTIDDPRPITRLFIEEDARHFEVVVGQKVNHELVPLGIRDAITHDELRDDEMPPMKRFTDAIRMWVWASANDPDSNGVLNINFVESEDSG